MRFPYPELSSTLIVEIVDGIGMGAFQSEHFVNATLQFENGVQVQKSVKESQIIFDDAPAGDGTLSVSAHTANGRAVASVPVSLRRGETGYVVVPLDLGTGLRFRSGYSQPQVHWGRVSVYSEASDSAGAVSLVSSGELHGGSGHMTLLSLSPGAYRLRIEHHERGLVRDLVDVEERTVTVTAGEIRELTVSVP